MMNVKMMMAMYVKKHQTTQTSAFDILLDWITIPSVDQTVSVQVLLQYWKRMNSSNMAWK
jgi:hypothetical protein